MGEQKEMLLIPREQWPGNRKAPAWPLPMLIWQPGKVKDDATGGQALCSWAIEIWKDGGQSCAINRSEHKALELLGADMGATPDLRNKERLRPAHVRAARFCNSSLPSAPAGRVQTLPRPGHSRGVEFYNTRTKRIIEEKVGIKVFRTGFRSPCE